MDLNIKYSDKEELFKFLTLEYFTFFENIAINMFKYDGFDEINQDPQFLEKTLFEFGDALFFNDDNIGYCILPCTATGLNYQGKPTRFQPLQIGSTFEKNEMIKFSKMYNIENSVFIKNNYLRRSTRPMIMYYCQRLADIEMTDRLNTNQCKTPYILKGKKSEILTMLNKVNQVLKGEEAIFEDKSLTGNNIDVLNTGVEFIGDELSAHFKTYVYKILEYLGINTIPTEKNERFLVDEVNGNNEFTARANDVYLKERQRAIDKINNMFGLNLSVSVNSDFIDDAMKNLPTLNEGGQENDNN